MRVFRATSLPYEEDYVVQRSSSPLLTSRKRLRLDMEEANRNKLRYQPVAASREEETIRLMFSYYRCTSEVKLNIKWPMAFLAKKINLDITDEMLTLSALYFVKNFKLCNKHLCLLARHLGLVTRKAPIFDFKSQLDSIWHHRSGANFKHLVIENSAWFIESVMAALL